MQRLTFLMIYPPKEIRHDFSQLLSTWRHNLFFYKGLRFQNYAWMFQWGNKSSGPSEPKIATLPSAERKDTWNLQPLLSLSSFVNL